MKNSFSAVGIMLTCMVFALACKKKNHNTGNDTADNTTGTTTSPTPVYDDYAQLKAGNYWIYGRYRVDADGTVTNLNQYDSCYVIKDTTIRGQKYFMLHKHDFIRNQDLSLALRDSLDCIINSAGGILFSYANFSKAFNTYYNTVPPADTICKITYKMEDKDQLLTVPAGSFTTSSMKGTYSFYPNYVVSGQQKRYMNNRYAKNTGLISETEDFYLSTNYMIERRLVRYHLN